MGQQLVRVTKANDLIEASYRLTLNEQRLVLSAVALIDSQSTTQGMQLRDGRKMRISAAAFAEAFDVDRRTAYEALQDACDRLYERSIKRIAGRTREKFRWVSSVAYLDGEGCAEIGWSPEILPYLTLLGKRFTTYELRQITALSSPYAIRLYEILKQFTSTGERYITLEDFREWLDLGEQYPRFYDLKQRIIQPSVRELTLHTDLIVEWEAIKKGRKVTSLHFSFEEKKQRELGLDTSP